MQLNKMMKKKKKLKKSSLIFQNIVIHTIHKYIIFIQTYVKYLDYIIVF